MCDRLKQEQSEQKKAEEKTRREAIFQQYLQKKAEQDSAEEGVAPRRHPTPGNRTARLAARPKSQPPVSHHDDRVSHSSSHSSQEEIFPPGHSPVLNLKRTSFIVCVCAFKDVSRCLCLHLKTSLVVCVYI